MSTHPYQWSTEALDLAGKHGMCPDFVTACLNVCPDVEIVAHICALAALPAVGEYLAYTALKSMRNARELIVNEDREYAI